MSLKLHTIQAYLDENHPEYEVFIRRVFKHNAFSLRQKAQREQYCLCTLFDQPVEDLLRYFVEVIHNFEKR